MQLVVGLRDQGDLGADSRQRGADLAQEVERDEIRVVEAQPVEVVARHPLEQRVDQVAAQPWLSEVEAGEGRAARHLVGHLSRQVALKPVRVLRGERVIAAAAVERPVEDNAQPQGVGLIHQGAQVVGHAQSRVNGEEVAHGVGVAEAAAAVPQAHRLHRHEPERGHAEIAKIRQPLAHAAQPAHGPRR